MNVEEKIIKVLEKVKPYLNNDGGDVEFKKFEDGVVYVKLVGACSHCPHATMTLKNSIENLLITEIKEVIRVESYDE